MTTSADMKRVGIVGGSGYAAGELLRILLNHPEVRIEFIHSESNAGKPVASVHSGLLGDTDLLFSSGISLEDIDILFLCTPHGASAKFWKEHSRPEKLRVIDLSQDFRDESEGYVYGLPEVNFRRIHEARSIANPGCFATAIQLSLLPFAAAGILPDGDVNVTAITGATGAGVKPGSTTHFSWRTDNLSVYKPFTHQHLKEISMTLDALQPGHRASLRFIPMRGDFARGIFAVVTLKCGMDQESLRQLFDDYYAEAPFTVVSDSPIDLKQAVNTNKAIIHVETHDGMALVTTAIDNLLKGAAGQAVQNMNIMLGIDQRTGLRLKPSAF